MEWDERKGRKKMFGVKLFRKGFRAMGMGVVEIMVFQIGAGVRLKWSWERTQIPF